MSNFSYFTPTPNKIKNFYNVVISKFNLVWGFKPISAAILPNAEFDDIKIVLKYFLPWNWSKWQEGKAIGEFEDKFEKYFGAKHAIGFSSGRVGLCAILNSLISQYPISNISASGGSAAGGQCPEVITQAYTTIAIPIAIKQAGFVPIYVDIKEDTYNIDSDKIEAKITENTKAIIIQHTFGIPAEMDKISEICKNHNLMLIEDCAHSLGAEYGGKKIGTFGDAAFFSFGRDKIISSTSGGMLIANNDDLAKKIKEFKNNLPFPPRKWILRQLLHPLLFWCALPIYYFFNLGKYLIFLAQKFGLITRAYSQKEKKGDASDKYFYKLPNVLAILAFNQLEKMERFNAHRQKIAEIYQNEFHYDSMYYHTEIEINKNNKDSFHYDNMNYHSGVKIPLISQKSNPVFLYYTIQTERRDELLKFAAKKHIILGDWFPGALGPKGVNEEKFGYKKGDCPIAERVGAMSLNLPTNIKTSEKDAEKVVETIKGFLSKK